MSQYRLYCMSEWGGIPDHSLTSQIAEPYRRDRTALRLLMVISAQRDEIIIVKPFIEINCQ